MPQALFRTLLLFLAAMGVAVPAHARLIGVAIGVSRYADPRLARAALPGAAVDAEAMDAVLKAHGAATGDTIILTGADATAAAIRSAIGHLVATAGAGDRVVIYLSGHGAQIPARPGDQNEPDGLDEMFLAADAAPWDAATHSLPGAVKDDEFGGWIDQLRAKGASVWFVVDACNGGGLSRGGAQDASARVLDPALLGLPAALRGGRSDASGLADASPMAGAGKLVTFYAAPAGGVAWERPLAQDSGPPIRRGVFTWSLLRALGGIRAEANFLTLAAATDEQRRTLGPPGGPAWIGGDLDQPMLFAGAGMDLLSHARAASAAPVRLRMAVGPAGSACPGTDPDPAMLASPPATALHIIGCRRVMVDLQSSAAVPVTLRPWYRDASGSYVALAGTGGVTLAPGGAGRFGFTVTDHDPDTGQALPSGTEYLLLIADDGSQGAMVVPLMTGN